MRESDEEAIINFEVIHNLDEEQIATIPFVSNESLEKMDQYFSLTKCLVQSEYLIWKLLKKSMQKINTNCNNGIFHFPEECPAWIGLSVVAKNLPKSILVHLIIEG